MTLLRVLVLIALASAVWVPVGVWIGLRPRLAERVQPLHIDAAELAKALQGLGRGTAALLRGAA